MILQVQLQDSIQKYHPPLQHPSRSLHFLPHPSEEPDSTCFRCQNRIREPLEREVGVDSRNGHSVLNGLSESESHSQKVDQDGEGSDEIVVGSSHGLRSIGRAKLYHSKRVWCRYQTTGNISKDISGKT